MGVESRGGPRGRRFSKRVHFPFTSEKFSADRFLIKKVNSSTKFSDNLFSRLAYLFICFLKFIIHLFL